MDIPRKEYGNSLQPCPLVSGQASDESTAFRKRRKCSSEGRFDIGDDVTTPESKALDTGSCEPIRTAAHDPMKSHSLIISCESAMHKADLEAAINAISDILYGPVALRALCLPMGRNGALLRGKKVVACAESFFAHQAVWEARNQDSLRFWRPKCKESVEKLPGVVSLAGASLPLFPLSADVLVDIFGRLDHLDHFQFEATCKGIQRFMNSNNVWRNLCKTHWEMRWRSTTSLEAWLCEAGSQKALALMLVRLNALFKEWASWKDEIGGILGDVALDYSEAEHLVWSAQPEVHGRATALAVFAARFHQGSGVLPQDSARAARMFRMAAFKGCAQTEMSLKIFHHSWLYDPWAEVCG
eukprot:TRINITY_DN2097_c0_g1_i3.p1 TRINITY_DN2097_c0_g1~~TRINITY_DN2097_c0_g1_i3.p1  ORF type:complete len:356 (-),score=18.43 TRINITY_DN2097_c0_g1_i3:912-1979(-)